MRSADRRAHMARPPPPLPSRVGLACVGFDRSGRRQAQRAMALGAAHRTAPPAPFPRPGMRGRCRRQRPLSFRLHFSLPFISLISSHLISSRSSSRPGTQGAEGHGHPGRIHTRAQAQRTEEMPGPGAVQSSDPCRDPTVKAKPPSRPPPWNVDPPLPLSLSAAAIQEREIEVMNKLISFHLYFLFFSFYKQLNSI